MRAQAEIPKCKGYAMGKTREEKKKREINDRNKATSTWKTRSYDGLQNDRVRA